MKPLTETGYGIVISQGKPGEFLAHHGTSECRYFSFCRELAAGFNKRLREHKLRGKVVKMRVTYEVLP